MSKWCDRSRMQFRVEESVANGMSDVGVCRLMERKRILLRGNTIAFC
jgi:hypothetical protein